MKNALVASLLVATASGCGGGGASVTGTSSPAPSAPAPSPPAPPPAPAAISFKGIIGGTFGGRNFHGVVFPDGTLYGVYASASSSAAVGGGLQGSGSSSASSAYTSSNLKDYNGEGFGVRDASFSGTFEDNLFVTGTVTYAVSSVTPATLSGSVSYTATQSSIATVVGNYNGSVAVLPNSQLNTSLAIDASGNITGTMSSGCHITGQVSPASLDAVYNLTLNLNASPCVPAGTSFSGGAFFAVGSLYGVAQRSDRSGAVAFNLAKQ